MKEFAFKLNGAEYKCAVEEIEAGKTKVTVNGKVYEVETEAAAPAAKPAAKPAPVAPKPAAPAAAPQACTRCRRSSKEPAARIGHQSARY